ncbi:MAG: LacI family DNA-binding transcriptional regulator [Nakamurella sp.]
MGRQGQHTISDIAAAVGVSKASAARVLGGYGYSSKDVQARVTAAATELNYSPSRIARTMRSGRSTTIGFVCADISDAFFSIAMRGICDVANASGYQVFVTSSDDSLDKERSATDAMDSHQVDGLILTPISVQQHAHLDRLGDAGLAIVTLDRQLKGGSIDSVVADNQQATVNAVRRLIDMGHGRIGFLVSTQPEEPPRLRRSASGLRLDGPSRPSLDRTRGYLQAFREADLPVDRELVGFVPQDEPNRRPKEVRRMMALANPPTAIFTGDSYMTRSAFVTLGADGFIIPRDVSLVGFDDLEWTTLVSPQVTVVVQQAYEMGRVAAEQLFTRIRGEESPPVRALVPTRYVDRHSVSEPHR